ncbi:hypothetical protein BKA62DRAFT_721735 [Auriculariales sp. MPI-PUGE-AT-0066]|nr:hypothetical protein BKA62DRAFT_721735 [Auriculariales sp. MPI-PUGE-AT-0066]
MGRSRSGSSSSSSGSDSGHEVKKDKKDKKDKGDKKEKKEKKDKGDEHKEDEHKDDKGKEKEKDKGKDKEKKKDEDKDKDKKHKEEEEHKIPGIGKLPGPAGQLATPRAPMGASPCMMPVSITLISILGSNGDPLFLVLVPHKGGLHPGKMAIRPGANRPEIHISWSGSEIAHSGDYALVAFDPQRMHWVPAPRAELPAGARPVEGGHEEDGKPLYFALGLVNNGRVPGKAGRHLGGASVPYGGSEHLSEQAEILCWT